MKYGEKIKAICGHCGTEFIMSSKQKYIYLKYNWAQYCNKLCQMAAKRANRKSPIPEPNKTCPTCGNLFTSKYYDKKFCSINCYIESPQFKETSRLAQIKATEENCRKAGTRPGSIKIKCLECGKEHLAKPSQNKKFCNQSCYRKYYSKRFDRWINSPQTIALPQNFDEFLTLEELPCLIDGCNWRGHNLSYHMNWFHGVKARDFKKAAGFNLKSGIISAPLQDIMRRWARSWQTQGPPEPINLEGYQRESYHSLEAKEHAIKSRALKIAQYDNSKIHICAGCGKVFAQSTPFGKQKYCSIECRNGIYLKNNLEKKYPMVCSICGQEFKGNKFQKRRFEKGKIVACSFYCRQKRAGHIARGTWRGD